MWALGSGLSGKVLPNMYHDLSLIHKKNKPGMVVYTFNASAAVLGTGRSQARQPGGLTSW